MSLTINNYINYKQPLDTRLTRQYYGLDSKTQRFVRNVVNLSYRAGYERARNDYLERIKNLNSPKLTWEEDD